MPYPRSEQSGKLRGATGANTPGVYEHGFFHNAAATTGSWSMLIDLSSFTMTGGSVIGFSNLDGRANNNLAPGYATLQFLDSGGQPVSLAGTDFLGSFDYNWQSVQWDATSVFDLTTSRWDVIPDVGSGAG